MSNGLERQEDRLERQEDRLERQEDKLERQGGWKRENKANFL
jgi:hypothetical protein